MTQARPVALILLALLMTVTGIGTAMARGQMAAETGICGTGAQVVIAADGLPRFDAAGAPVLATEAPCLDCTFGALATPPDAPELAAHVIAPVPLAASGYDSPAPRPWRMGGMARSPPAAG